MTIANQLTLARILLTFLFMVLLFRGHFLSQCLALAVFLVASLTDLYDGKVARKRGQVSDFGKLMDPIADKILILSAFLAFVELRLVPAWMVMLMLTRELLITGVRLFALSNGKVLAAGRGGKHKTVTQTLAVIWVLLVFLARKKAPFIPFLNDSVFFVMLFTVWVTVSSGLLYLFRNRSLFYVKSF